MEKNRGTQNQLTGGSIVQPLDDTPTYSELGIDKTAASREQLVKRAFNEDRIGWLRTVRRPRNRLHIIT